MKLFKKTLLSLPLILSSGLSPLGHADDTEIYFNTPDAEIVKPNVLFVLDTSGSMSEKDGGSQDRLDRMKDAMRDIINGSSGVNMGLMRFRDQGGTVRYPITDMDKPILVGGGSSEDLTAYMGSGTDDAEQGIVSPVVTLDNLTLSLTHKDAGNNSVDVIINNKRNDARQIISGKNTESSNKTTSKQLTLGRSDRVTGFRFPNIEIPNGAKITSSYLEFTIRQRKDGKWDKATALDIDLENGDLGDFEDDNNDLKDRPLTGNAVTWSITADSPNVGEVIATSELNALIQSRVDADGSGSIPKWNSSGDTLTFILKYNSGSGDRRVESYDNGNNVPRLVINYSQGSTITTQAIGLRFEDVLIPQGATVTDANIDFTAAQVTSGVASFILMGEDIDDSPTFAGGTGNNGNITNRTRTTAAEKWVVEDWTTEGQVYSTPNLSSIINEIVSREDWCGGNSLTIMMEGSTNTSNRIAESFEGNSAAAPKLRLKYDAASIPEINPANPSKKGGCTIREIAVRINANSNDAEDVNGDIYLNSSDLDFGSYPVGLLFEELPLSQGSDIISANITFVASADKSGSFNLDIWGERNANPSTFTYASDAISGRDKTTKQVDWDNPPSWSQNESYTTPDLRELVQEIVNLDDWKTGNPMVFLFSKYSSNSNRREAKTYNESKGSAPLLKIKAKTYGASVTRTARDELIEYINELPHSGGTPVVDALYEAALYYKGLPVDKGRARGQRYSSSQQNDRVSNDDSFTGGKHYYPSGCSIDNLSDSDCAREYIDGSPVYISPITDECQKTNHLILLTDGSATQNTSQSKIRSMIKSNSCINTGDVDEECGEDLTDYLYQKDQSDLPGDQFIKTYTVGFNNDDKWLQSLATDSGAADPEKDGYYTASSASDLVKVVEDIITEALDIDTTFVSPGVTVNSFNRLNHRNELYFSVFKPLAEPLWPGNLKRYRLRGDGVILDSKGAAAVDDVTGFFKPASQSWWSPTADGSVVSAGGSASVLPDTRTVLTTASGSNTLVSLTTANVSKDRLGLPNGTSDADYKKLVNWARGQDVDDIDKDNNFSESRHWLGAPLHSTPKLVTYGGTDANPEIFVFYGDNDGFVHAINSETGVVKFSIIPEELLPNLKVLQANNEAAAVPYGMDGEIALWVESKSGNSINTASGSTDHVYLYSGMRRGGKNYYAFDATNLNNTSGYLPKMMWRILSGSVGFEELGQTWSKPIITTIQNGNDKVDVAIFAGGYDVDQDDVTVRTEDNEGRAIYIVNAETGALIWSGGGVAAKGTRYRKRFADMKYSIPSDIRVIDTNGDGLTDQMYVGDMGGQLWRFDINNGETDITRLVDGGVIADLAGSTAATNRKFFYRPDISIMYEGSKSYLAIGFGSGNRAHPLSKGTEDRIYMIKNYDVTSAPEPVNTSQPVSASNLPVYTKLTESDLYDTTENKIQDGTDAEKTLAEKALLEADGWMIQLSKNGEKSLSEMSTYADVMYFTTYEPVVTTKGCSVVPGQGGLYIINKRDGSAAENLDGLGGDDPNLLDRSIPLNTPSIPGSVVIITVPPEDKKDDPNTPEDESQEQIDGGDIICVGAECRKPPSADKIKSIYWKES